MSTLPYTGSEYLESLDDGREVWIYGERVKKIAEHPAFRNCARLLPDPRSPTSRSLPIMASRRFKTVASGLIYLNSHADDFKTPESFADTWIATSAGPAESRRSIA